MQKKTMLLATLVISSLFCPALFAVDGCSAFDKKYCIENDYLGRSLAIVEGKLKTVAIVNKRFGNKTIIPSSCEEFRIRISQGTHTTGTDTTLTTDDFQVESFSHYPLEGKIGKGFAFRLKNKAHLLTVTVSYELRDAESYIRKRLTILSGKPVTLERIDVEAIGARDAYQPYSEKLITAKGPNRWKPGLGQPLFTTETGTFWGIEFPAANNFVKDGTLYCGYLWGREIEANHTYNTYRAVVGVSDDPEYTSDAFYEYINHIRVRPLRLRVQYNSWFDYGGGVNKDKFKSSVTRIHDELVVKRGNKPFQAQVIDDGWQDTEGWKETVWKVNHKFDHDFSTSLRTVRDAKSELGIWLSPQCNFGAKRAVPDMRKNGFEALENWMSLAGPNYMKALEQRMLELTGLGISYFKLDGCFGHLNTREFDIYGDKHGLPYMPQLGLEGLKPNSQELNDPKYDELKIYYLVAGSEKLMQIFKKMDEINPDVYIVISNGAWLSPWWMMHCDTVWMINAGDAAGGSDRTQELVYRDGIYYDIWVKENTHYPQNSLFNHEPKKTKTGESKDAFRDYLYMNMSRGTGFIELYIKTFKLADQDWDVLSEGLHWAGHIFPTFGRSTMHGGNPKKDEVYGFTGWNAKQGYVSIHNPGDKAKSYTFKLNRKFGLLPDSGQFNLSSPIQRCVKGLNKDYRYGDSLTLDLDPKEIIILNFDKDNVDWKLLRDLQK
ncbi:MAG: hypothetical protein QNK25_04975 [Desulfobacterales bacterium]|nr:hypothetical protein [Desulfobacterales bacterium]